MGAIRGEKSCLVPLVGLATLVICTLVYSPALFRSERLLPFPIKAGLHASKGLNDHLLITVTRAVESNITNSDSRESPIKTTSTTTEFLPEKEEFNSVATSDDGNVHFKRTAQPPEPPKYLSYPGGEPMALHWHRCAYVTGSGHLKGKGHGKDIDAYDCVIRPNDAPTVGYEEDAGSKTTLRTVDRRSLGMIKRRLSTGSSKFDTGFSEEIIVVGSDFSVPGKARDLADELLKRWPGLTFYGTTSGQLQRLNELFESRVARIDTQIWISNGFRSLILARDLCDEIHVYGIVDEDYCNRLKNGESGLKPTQYYYYTNLGLECDIFNRHAKKKTWAHRFLREKKAFAQFAKEWGNLHFHEPEWPELQTG